ncbi:hypothetical protein C1645_750182 [Glomus cerebriforme]|uniref:Uncharacterized protein n=1 Tax=Glomus cerebriforme TaxID=658196 RepID=A0A397TPF3_9GLOM|nr:hypothetical protein C1645_750182 [Glomus cerebriforme]
MEIKFIVSFYLGWYKIGNLEIYEKIVVHQFFSNFKFESFNISCLIFIMLSHFILITTLHYFITYFFFLDLRINMIILSFKGF